MAARSSLTVESLAKLGAEHLAEILIAEAECAAQAGIKTAGLELTIRRRGHDAPALWPAPLLDLGLARPLPDIGGIPTG